MEVQTTDKRTDMQRNEARFEEIVAQIQEIGRKWVAQATGYSEQHITNYTKRRKTTARLELSIIENLEKALRLKQEDNHSQYRDVLDNAQASLQKAIEMKKKEEADLKKISNFLQHFEEVVRSN